MKKMGTRGSFLKKKALTLIEILVAFSLLIMVALPLFSRGYGLLKRHRAEATFERFLSELKFCQNLARLQKNDCRIELHNEEDQLILSSLSSAKNRIKTSYYKEIQVKFLEGESLLGFSETGEPYPASSLTICSCSSLFEPRHLDLRILEEQEVE